ncbi:MAG: phenylacetic acid degradation bifunctional protein PaaZ [Pseudomonadota bacterium]
MSLIQVHSFARGAWAAPRGARPLLSAVTGEAVAEAGAEGLDTLAMAEHARAVGGPALRALTFHDRARLLKALALALTERKAELYALSHLTGATQGDNLFDIDGGIGTLFVYASKGRREMPDAQTYLEGGPESLSRSGAFQGRHVCVPLQGVAVHVNAFNFPVWGMLEKLAPCLLAGVPAIVKPATATSYLTEAAFRILIEADVLPEGAVQLIAGGVGPLLDHLGPQDAVAFTGSADTALKLRANPNLLRNAVRFTAEQDSLNASVLGPDAAPGTPEFDAYVREVAKEMTTKAGQKCTAVRRCIVPAAHADAVAEALSERLRAVRIGDPALETTRMGALASAAQKADVQAKSAAIAAEATAVLEGWQSPPDGVDPDRGAFVPPALYRCDDPDGATAVHETEAFGPVSTLMPYRDAAHSLALANRGGGSLVASVFTHDPGFAKAAVAASAAWHGRLYFADRDIGKEGTGHGAPMPHMVHGGPGRAGGGEEQGGIRGVLHYMQRTAVQGSPRMLAAIGDDWLPGAPETPSDPHPFQRRFGDLAPGQTIRTEARTVTLEDIEHFAHFTGDLFYAHMDEAAARANPFFPGRVAHGYLLLSFAAGLFVSAEPGPTLANTGLEGLRFMAPVSPGDALTVRLTVKSKKTRNDDYGEVRWDVAIHKQGEADAAPIQAAAYDLLTMNAV